MGEPDAERNVYVFEIGEAFDDMRPAFWINASAYQNSASALVAVETAEAVMARTGVLFGIEVRSGPGAHAVAALPTWDEFYRRHFIDGVPLPARAQPSTFDVPHSWQAMHAEMIQAHEALQVELERDLNTALPGKRTYVESRTGPTRYSAGSVRLQEELYGFTVELAVAIGDDDLDSAFERLLARLAASAWHFAPGSQALIRRGRRDLFQISLRVNGTFIRLIAYSPLYRASDEPAGEWAIEERPTVV
ncbi:hypothetical protein [Jidongwangia harbinensis]|uniref:hypothetical protein n=1 Tax=Jidongwangia harbinensis TaxID=2878561 RepID=UPI001CD9215E|nr:hypothetical protein [Jidongwangia harbinensis]MCA2212701.1 hypothetical protein [Jidongwangia harbinensis]